MSHYMKSAVTNPNAMSITAATRTFGKLKYIMKIWNKSFEIFFGLEVFFIRNKQLPAERK